MRYLLTIAIWYGININSSYGSNINARKDNSANTNIEWMIFSYVLWDIYLQYLLNHICKMWLAVMLPYVAAISRNIQTLGIFGVIF